MRCRGAVRKRESSGKDNDWKNTFKKANSVLVLMIQYRDNVFALFAFCPSLLQ